MISKQYSPNKTLCKNSHLLTKWLYSKSHLFETWNGFFLQLYCGIIGKAKLYVCMHGWMDLFWWEHFRFTVLANFKEILPFATTWMNREDKYIKWNKTGTERQTLHNSTYMWNREKSNLTPQTNFPRIFQHPGCVHLLHFLDPGWVFALLHLSS